MAWAAFDENGKMPITVFDGWFSFRYAENPGVAWSFLSSYPLELTVLTSLISIALCFYALYSSSNLLVLISWSFVVGGAVGNIVDRFHGIVSHWSGFSNIDPDKIYVRDFIDIYWGSNHWPTFNIADSMICIGVSYLFFYSFFIENKKDEVSEVVSTNE